MLHHIVEGLYCVCQECSLQLYVLGVSLELECVYCVADCGVLSKDNE